MDGDQIGSATESRPPDQKRMCVRQLVLCRPYTIISIAAIGLIVNILVNGTLTVNLELFTDMAAPVLIWVFMLFLVELVHKQEDRPMSKLLFVVPFSLFVLICLWRGPLALVVVLAQFVVAYAYSLKSVDFPLSPLSPFVRGLNEIFAFWIVSLFYYQSLSGSFSFLIANSQIVLVVYLTTVSRNIIGDLRDIDYDRFTLSRKFGARASLAISAILIVISLFLLYGLPYWLGIPLVVQLMLIISMRISSYTLHKTYIVSSTAFMLGFVVYLMQENPLPLLLFYISALLLITYDYVPRRANKDHWGGVSRWRI